MTTRPSLTLKYHGRVKITRKQVMQRLITNSHTNKIIPLHSMVITFSTLYMRTMVTKDLTSSQKSQMYKSRLIRKNDL